MIIKKKIDGNIITTSSMNLTGNLIVPSKSVGGGSSITPPFLVKPRWGGIDGDLEEQEDLWEELESKINEDDIQPLDNQEIERIMR